MNEEMLAWMVPVIVALTRLCKGRVEDSLLPVIATALGIAIAIGWTLAQGDALTNSVMALGIAAGVGAMGAYSGVKTLVETRSNDTTQITAEHRHFDQP